MTANASGPAWVGRSQEEVADFSAFTCRCTAPTGAGWAGRAAATRNGASPCCWEVGTLSGSRVLDVGCGVGDLYGYALRQGLRVRYTGLDILPEMVAHARGRYPEARFEVGDALQGLGADRFDYVL